ncbi:hypothetical protein GCM10023189_33830 [Nibrella saemangeumensis]|uniref:Erythromycin biosynthesis protein CIII-like C-terminal domain-containing protein n=1 Tax=Nibrella saemangeumensis TaxID=1084526 RepID=A0ABP8N1N6_9BACT
MKTSLNILMVTIDGGGNVPPMFGLAKQLAKRGHTIRVLTEPCLESAVRTSGFAFIGFQDHFTRTNRKEDIIKDWNTSPFTNPVFENVILGPAKTLVHQTVEAIRKYPTDLVLVDLLLVPALIAAQALQMPGVLVFHMPEYLPGTNRPPGGMGLLPGKGWIGRARDRFLATVFNRVLNKYRPLLNEVRAQYSLEKLENVSDLMHQADLRLIQTIRSFDIPLEPGPANVRYTGPNLTEPDWAAPWSDPWPENDSRPLLVSSFSTTFQNQHSVIQNVIHALGELDVRGLATLGLAMEHETFDVPDNVVVVGSAPHAQVFPVADLVITHAGHGTIMRALANGLPLICLPMGRDQNDNAALVVHHGCGIKLSPKASRRQIRQAIDRILTDESFRQNAARFQSELYNQKDEEASLIELEKLAESGLKKRSEIA